MSGLRELSSDEIIRVSGGESWATEQHHEQLSRGGSGSHGAPKTTANDVGFAIMAGTITTAATVLGGPIVGGITGTAFAMANAAMPPSQADNPRRGGGWHDTNPGGAVGQCRW